MHKHDVDNPDYIKYLHERDGQAMLPAAAHRDAMERQGRYLTPCARDWKDTGDLSSLEPNTLPRQIQRDSELIEAGRGGPSSPQRRSAPDSLSSSQQRSDADSGEKTLRMCLNPAWVEWRVGMRLGHTAFPD